MNAVIDRVDPDGSNAGYIPLGFYLDFLEYLAARRDLIEIITYRDLAWGDDRDHAGNYPGEWRAWQAQLRSGERDPSKIYVLIQHDVDSRPERSMLQVRHEMRIGIPTNVMVFNRRVDRRHLRDTGVVRLTEYAVDDALLRAAAEQGFVVGLHSNAFERSGFDMAAAREILGRDVGEMAARFPLEFYTAHGGTPGPGGENNRDVTPTDAVSRRVRWVHNGASPRFDGGYSDGGLNSPRRDPAGRDLRDFVRTWRPGRRYRVLTHPQYYWTPCSVSPRLAGTPWYEAVRDAYRTTPPANAWDGVPVAAAAPPKAIEAVRRAAPRPARGIAARLREVYRRIAK